jgi:hypothetical protein
MREMTMKEYFKHRVMQEVIRDAEKEGIRIVKEKSRPRLVEDPKVIEFREPGEMQT